MIKKTLEQMSFLRKASIITLFILNFESCSISDPGNNPFITEGSQNGSEQNPYLIYNSEQLRNLERGFVYNGDIIDSSESLSQNYKLSSNLDFSDEDFDPIGSSTQPFTGSLDGGGYTISGLVIDEPSDSNCVGFFAKIKKSVLLEGGGGTGKNIFNLTIKAPVVSGGTNVGAVVGCNEAGTLSEVSITEKTDGAAAGLNTVNELTLGRVTGIEAVGGLIGKNTGIVQASAVSVIVAAERKVAALIGINDEGGEVQNSLAEGEVRGTEIVGGMIGVNKGKLYRVISYAHLRDRLGQIHQQMNMYQYGGLIGLNEQSLPAANIIEAFWETDDFFPMLQDIGSGNNENIRHYTPESFRGEGDLPDGLFDGWDRTIWDFGEPGIPPLIFFPGNFPPPSTQFPGPGQFPGQFPGEFPGQGQ